jgi:hypothetical protein
VTKVRLAVLIVACLAVVPLAFTSPAADPVEAPAIQAEDDGPLMTPMPEPEEPWLLPEPVQLACTASFTCPDGSFIQCTDPAQCFVYAYICAIRCGNNNVVKCNNWPPSCEDPCDYSACIGQGGSQSNCEDLHCTGFGGPD